MDKKAKKPRSSSSEHTPSHFNLTTSQLLEIVFFCDIEKILVGILTPPPQLTKYYIIHSHSLRTADVDDLNDRIETDDSPRERRKQNRTELSEQQ
jgi:hypothetical protein